MFLSYTMTAPQQARPRDGPGRLGWRAALFHAGCITATSWPPLTRMRMSTEYTIVKIAG